MAQYALKWGEFVKLMFRALALRNSAKSKIFDFFSF